MKELIVAKAIECIANAPVSRASSLLDRSILTVPTIDDCRLTLTTEAYPPALRVIVSGTVRYPKTAVNPVSTAVRRNIVGNPSDVAKAPAPNAPTIAAESVDI